MPDAAASDVYLDGGPSEAAQLLDVLSFLSDDGPDGLRWDVHVDRLLLWSLDTHMHARLHHRQDDLSGPEGQRCFPTDGSH